MCRRPITKGERVMFRKAQGPLNYQTTQLNCVKSKIRELKKIEYFANSRISEFSLIHRRPTESLKFEKIAKLSVHTVTLTVNCYLICIVHTSSTSDK